MRAIVIGVLVAASAPAGAADELAGFVGVWRGESLCTVKPNPCHDETVVYHFARSKKIGSALVLTANKIVDGQEVTMGVLDCTFDAAAKSLGCAIPSGVFRYQLDGRTMTGTLDLSDGTRFRRVLVRRADSPLTGG